ncbi:MAG: secondary thiamine-phosphate synthase enzyme YjbQ [Phycisphaerae bacterium]|nr:secondary thiamine-phosphate synthase enzyme YjbQ [Phycisphaerae bacterium]
MHRTLVFDARARGMRLITDDVAAVVRDARCVEGLCVVFLRHTSASLLIQENADPTVGKDFERFFARLVPDGDSIFAHDDEGPDDMPAHVRSALTQTSLAIPIIDGRLALGTWQGIFLCEHRTMAHRREVIVGVYGDG